MKSIVNFRSFTGLKTRENAVIKENKLFRSAAPEYGTKEDFLKLHALKLDSIIDFRDEFEKKPLLQQSFNEQFHRQSAAINVANFFNHEEIKAIGLKTENIDLYYNDVYRALPTHFHHQYQVLTQGLNDGHTLLFHCSAGKDRTGFGAYLILSALNVHHDDIMEDYLRSNQSALELYESRKHEDHQLMQEDLSREIIERLFGVRAEYLDSAMQSIQQNYKNNERYLSEVLCADIDNIRTHYLI